MEMLTPKIQSDNSTDTPAQIIPDNCHKVCNHAAVEATPNPRDWTICVIDSHLQVNAANCLNCIVSTISSDEPLTYTQSDADILSTLRAWRDFCHDRDDGYLTKAVDDMSLIIGDSDSIVALPSCPAVPQATQTRKLPFSTSCMGTYSSSLFVWPSSTSSQVVVGATAESTATATTTPVPTSSDVGAVHETVSETASGAASVSAVSFAPAQLLLLVWVLLSGW
ncbi:uncharacterized protein KD926_008860 [Aspergillus affinis]|uniref:uncharacterized protein n=1 Tax=Aspergillus affinis TaxID=1070780 RepID=UPI0022FEA083|nr:uncharacterized protein KD926_008860 [Aspergillus affinis]KAI9045433.1 hypothetical protein KD926_008860 [Aspergillus affinis]